MKILHEIYEQNPEEFSNISNEIENYDNEDVYDDLEQSEDFEMDDLGNEDFDLDDFDEEDMNILSVELDVEDFDLLTEAIQSRVVNSVDELKQCVIDIIRGKDKNKFKKLKEEISQEVEKDIIDDKVLKEIKNKIINIKNNKNLHSLNFSLTDSEFNITIELIEGDSFSYSGKVREDDIDKVKNFIENIFKENIEINEENVESFSIDGSIEFEEGGKYYITFDENDEQKQVQYKITKK